MMYYVSLAKKVKSTTCISKEKRDCSVQVSLIICDKEALRESMQEAGEDFYIAYRLNYMVAEQHLIKYVEGDSALDVLKDLFPQFLHVPKSADRRAISMYADLQGIVSLAGIEV